MCLGQGLWCRLFFTSLGRGRQWPVLASWGATTSALAALANGLMSHRLLLRVCGVSCFVGLPAYGSPTLLLHQSGQQHTPSPQAGMGPVDRLCTKLHGTLATDSQNTVPNTLFLTKLHSLGAARNSRRCSEQQMLLFSTAPSVSCCSCGRCRTTAWPFRVMLFVLVRMCRLCGP
jgi:hypothetical protein